MRASEGWGFVGEAGMEVIKMCEVTEGLSPVLKCVREFLRG